MLACFPVITLEFRFRENFKTTPDSPTFHSNHAYTHLTFYKSQLKTCIVNKYINVAQVVPLGFRGRGLGLKSMGRYVEPPLINPLTPLM